MQKIHYQEIVSKYSNMLFNLAYGFCHNRQDAEDILQDVFLKLLQQKKEFESDEHVKAWLIRVTINHSKNYKNLVWFKRRSEKDVMEYVSEIEESDNDLWLAVDSLPAKYSAILFLFYKEDMSIKEIAKALGKSESTIGTRLDRARKKLKAILEV